MNPRIIRKLWMTHAPSNWWGDDLDVRFYLCHRLSKVHNKKVLDVGCNAGITTSCLNADNVVYGVDLNQKSLSIAKIINPKVTFIRDDFFNLQKHFKKSFFDVIILSHVLPKDNYQSEHFPEELLDVIVPLLKKGGKLYLTTPSVERCYNRKSKFINRPYIVHLMNRYSLEYDIKNWCPWSIHLNRMFRFIPAIFNILEYLSEYTWKSVAFYVEATKK